MLRGLIDTPEQDPRRDRHAVNVSLLGTLSRLIGQKITTALYEDEDIGALIGHLLDEASWPKNAQAYITSLSPSGQWGLGEASGNAIDLSGNGNDGAVTIGAGARDAAALDDGGDGAITFDGAATLVSIPADAAIDNMWDGGGTLMLLFNLTSAGEGSNAYLFAAGTGIWGLRAISPSGGACKLRLQYNFSGDDSVWVTTDAVVTFGVNYALMVLYNADAVTNDPTFYLFNLDAGTLQTLTVGSGITESSTPTGTRDTDAAVAKVIGNLSDGSKTTDGVVDEPAVFKAATKTLAQFKAWLARCMDAPRHLDAGITAPSFWWADNVDAFAALVKLVNTEGPGAVVYEDGTGAIVFKNRHAIVLEARSTADQTTFRTAAGATEPRVSGFRYDPGLRDKIKIATATVKTRTAKSLAVAWTGPTPVTLAPGEAVSYLARTSGGDPMKAAVTPVLNTDYTVSAGSVASVTLDRTSGASITVTITAGASGATFAALQLRAQTVSVDSVTEVSDQHGNTGTNLPSYVLPVLAEISVSEAQDFCDAVVGFYQDGRPRASLLIEPLYADARMTAALAREIHDRVRVIDPETNTDKDYYVHQKTLMLTAPNRLVATLEIEDATSPSLFVIGTSELDGVDVLGW